MSARADLGSRLFREVFLAGRFAMVGLVATFVHMLMVWMLIDRALAPPLLANLLAFLTAFSVSFLGHYFWTFGPTGDPGRAVRRLFVISASAFLLNTVVLAGLLEAAWAAPELSAVVAATVVPLVSYLASRFWGFRR